ncbi:MAG: response regulator transcription factor [Candidatus Sericytochromatia bacterium]
MGKRILIVEDEPDLVEVLSIIFRAYGYETEVAGDGVSALEAIAEKRPDLVLMDVMMPRMNGLEVCRRLKQDPATRALPVVLLTAKAHDVDKASGLEAGADAYLAKPFENADLIATVQRVLAEASR